MHYRVINRALRFAHFRKLIFGAFNVTLFIPLWIQQQSAVQNSYQQCPLDKCLKNQTFSMDKGKTIYLSKTNVVIAPIWSLCSVSAGKLARSMRHLSIKSPKSPKPSQPMLPCSAYCQNPLKDSTEWVGMRKRKGKGIYSEELPPVRWLGVLSLHPPFPVDVRRCAKLFFRWRKGTKAGNIFSVPEQRKGNSLLCLPILSQGVGTW